MPGLIIYLASPYGFTDSGRAFLENEMIPAIRNRRSIMILNPWEDFDKLSCKFGKILAIDSVSKQKRKLRKENSRLGQDNEKRIKKSAVVIAVLDGSDVDSGVAAEIGYAVASGKKVIGYRNDFRQTGDNPGATVNVQVEYFIRRSGGTIVNTTCELKKELGKLLRP
jgi:nucleoside 2-deoxyribosyltransferase